MFAVALDSALKGSGRGPMAMEVTWRQEGRAQPCLRWQVGVHPVAETHSPARAAMETRPPPSGFATSRESLSTPQR